MSPLQETRSIFMTNVNGSDEAVMVFTRLDAETIERACRNSGKVTFDECYEVPGHDAQYYLYEPCWLSLAEEEQARRLAA